jgi:hypothetical protein
MLHIGAGVQTLSYADIGVKTLCYIKGQFCIEIGTIYLCAFVVFLAMNKNQMFV